MPVKFKLAILSLVVAAWSSSKVMGQVCPRVDLASRPSSVTSGAWASTSDGLELLLVDSLNKQVFRYDESGRERQLPEGLNALLPSMRPSFILPREGGGLVVQVEDDTLLGLDRRFIPTSRKALRRPNSANETIEGMFLWQPVGDDIISFSDIHNPRRSNGWSPALIRFTPERPETGFRKLIEYRSSDQLRIVYRLGYHYLAASGDIGYALLGESNGTRLVASLKQGLPGGGKEDSLVEVRLDKPEALGHIPPLPPFKTADDVAPLMRAVEASEMPVGLYAWGEDTLYLLKRSPLSKGRTQWSLLQIKVDWHGGVRGGVVMAKIGDEIVLPLKASNVTVIPGPEKWAFIERGPIRSYFDETTNAIKFIPTSAIVKMRLSPRCD